MTEQFLASLPLFAVMLSSRWRAPDDVGSPLVALAQDVEEERVHIVVQRLVV